MHPDNEIGIYVHWPFCKSKCPYCDFNVHVRDDIDHARWRDVYLKVLEVFAEKTQGRLVRSLYFGGGTPSTMQPETVQAIIDQVRSLWRCVNDIEITLEANPTSIEADKFLAFKGAGVNRVSVGVQAFNDFDLKFLGRQHSADEARKALQIAGDVFDRFSFDLIYARPEQSLDDWKRELSEAVELSKGHLSLYQLTIERSTPFYFSHAQGRFQMPSEELSAEFYTLTQEVLERARLPAYEVSNHAAEGQESAHNMIYWRYGDYIGIGPGAHGRLSLNGDKYATRGHHAPDKWLEAIEQGGDGCHPYADLNSDEMFLEAFMMGLRLKEGVAIQTLNSLTGKDYQAFLDAEHLQKAQGEGWLELNDKRIVLSLEGRLRLNALVPYLLKD